MSSKAGLDVLLAGLYEEGGPATEDADLLFMSIPNAMLKRIHMDATREISRRDAGLLAGLEKAGFKLDNGPDDSGFFMRTSNEAVAVTLTLGLVSLSSTARSRSSRVRRSQKSSSLFEDGSELEADGIVFATGYENMRGYARKIFGDEIADGIKDVWGFDKEGELRLCGDGLVTQASGSLVGIS